MAFARGRRADRPFLGAYTALALAGGVPHTQHQMAHDPACKIASSQAVPVKADPRVKSLVLLAPATAWYLSDGALAKVTTPLLILSGERDQHTPSFHAEIVTKGLPASTPRTHRVIKNTGHFSFLSPFPSAIKAAGIPPAMDPEGFNREEFQAEMRVEILNYLRATLQLDH